MPSAGSDAIIRYTIHNIAPANLPVASPSGDARVTSSRSSVSRSRSPLTAPAVNAGAMNATRNTDPPASAANSSWPRPGEMVPGRAHAEIPSTATTVERQDREIEGQQEHGSPAAGARAHILADDPAHADRDGRHRSRGRLTRGDGRFVFAGEAHEGRFQAALDLAEVSEPQTGLDNRRDCQGRHLGAALTAEMHFADVLVDVDCADAGQGLQHRRRPFSRLDHPQHIARSLDGPHHVGERPFAQHAPVGR